MSNGRNRFRASRYKQRLYAALLVGVLGLDIGQAEEFIASVPIRKIVTVDGNHYLTMAAPPAESRPGALFLTEGLRPLSVLRRSAAVDEETASYDAPRPIPATVDPSRLEAWILSPDYLRGILSDWPVEAVFRSRISTIGLGGTTVWLDAGARQGIEAGDHWWQRNSTQPVARYDVLYVGDEDCYCRVCPLVSGWQPKVGDAADLWPPPGMQRTGRAASAVVYVQSLGTDQEIWVALLPGADVGEDTRIDFYRDGRFLVGGVIHRADTRFGYVRLSPTPDAVEIRVGDDAVIRTATDTAGKRFSGRIFDLTAEGGLIDVGEVDGLRAGDVAAVYREGVEIGSVEITRTQRTYALVRPHSGGPIEERAILPRKRDTTSNAAGVSPAVSAPALDGQIALSLGDVVRFGADVARSETLGTIDEVCDRILLSVKLAGSTTGVTEPPLFKPLLIRRDGRTIGVAVPLRIEEGRALALAVAESLTDAVQPGDRIAASAYGD